MKKHIILLALSSTLIISACSPNEEAQESDAENDTEQVASASDEQEKEREEQLRTIEPKEYSEPVPSVIDFGQDVTRQAFGDYGEDINVEKLDDELQRNNNSLDEAIEVVEEESPLSQDLKYIRERTDNLNERVSEEGEDMIENERYLLVSELMDHYNDLNFYVNEISDYTPANRTNVAMANMEKALQEGEWSEEFNELSEEVQRGILDENNFAHLYIRQEEVRQAVKEAETEIENMNGDEAKYLIHQMENNEKDKDEVISEIQSF